MAKSSRTQMRLSQLTGSLGVGAGKIRPDVAAGTLAGLTALDLSGSLSAMLSGISRVHGRTGDNALNNASGTFYVDIVPDADGTLDLGNASAEFAEAHVNAIKSATTLDVDSTGKLSLDGAGGIDIGVAADVAIDVDASTLDIDTSDNITITAGGSGKLIDIDASGTLSLDSATGIDIGKNADKPIDIDSTTLDIDASGAISIDASTGNAIDITAGAASLFKTTAGDFQLKAEAAKVVISGSSGADSLHVQSAATFDGAVVIAGDLDVNGTTTTIDSTNTQFEDRIIGLGVSGSNGNYSNLDVGMIFGFGEKSSAQAAVRYVGTSNRFELGRYIAAPGSGSFGAATAFSDLKVNNLELAGGLALPDSAGDHTLTLEANGDDLSADRTLDFIVADSGGTDANRTLHIEANTVKLDQDYTIDATVQFAGLNLSEGDITNAGDINADSLSVDDATVGLSVDFSGANTGLSKILLRDGMADALNIMEGSNSYMQFSTTDNQEAIVISKYTQIQDDIPLAFGQAPGGDYRFFYDEAGSDKLVLSASVNGGIKSFLIGDNHEVSLEFQNGNAKIFAPTPGELKVAASNSFAIESNFVEIGDAGDGPGVLRFMEDGDNGSNYVQLQAGAALASNVTLKLPITAGSAGQVMRLNASDATQLEFGDAGNAAKKVVSGSATAQISAGTDLSTGGGLAAFDLALHSSITDSNLGNSLAMFVNGQLLFSGSEAQRAAGGCDYAVSKSGNNFRLKLAFDLEIEDVVQAIIR